MRQAFHPDPVTVSLMIEAQAALGDGFRNCIYRRALAGDIRLIEVQPGITAKVLKPYLALGGGIVAIIGNDAGVTSGPDSFGQARRLLGWASHAMVNAAGGQDIHYQAAADTAAAGASVLLIETHTLAEAAWMELAAEERDRRAKRRQRPLSLLLVRVPPHPASSRDGRVAA